MPYWNGSWRSLLAIGIGLVLSGCATVRSYDRELNGTLEQASLGSVDSAIRLLDAANPDRQSLLYQLELGMLQRLGNRYDESQKAWSAASAVHPGRAGGRPVRSREADGRRGQLHGERQAARVPPA